MNPWDELETALERFQTVRARFTDSGRARTTLEMVRCAQQVADAMDKAAVAHGGHNMRCDNPRHQSLFRHASQALGLIAFTGMIWRHSDKPRAARHCLHLGLTNEQIREIKVLAAAEPEASGEAEDSMAALMGLDIPDDPMAWN